MSVSNQAFFGSKLFPLSAAKSAEGIKSKPLYESLKDEDLRELDDEELFREIEIEAWEKSKDDWELHFAEVPGWRRKYAVERPEAYGGNMLDAEYTGKENDSMSIVLIGGLTDEELEEIESSEDIYEKSEVNVDELDFYGEKPFELPENVLVYTGGDHEAFNEATEETRSRVYNERILRGLEIMEDEGLLDTGDKEKIRESFINNTYETWPPGLEVTEATESAIEDNPYASIRRNDEIEAIAEMHGYEIS